MQRKIDAVGVAGTTEGRITPKMAQKFQLAG
jgi:hypothetical protein